MGFFKKKLKTFYQVNYYCHQPYIYIWTLGSTLIISFALCGVFWGFLVERDKDDQFHAATLGAKKRMLGAGGQEIHVLSQSS